MNKPIYSIVLAFDIAGRGMPQIHVNCALCDEVFAIWNDVRYGYKVLKHHRKQSGLALKMAATRIRKYIIYQHMLALYSHIIPLLYLFWCEDSISEVFSLFGGQLHGQNLFSILFIVKIFFQFYL